MNRHNTHTSLFTDHDNNHHHHAFEQSSYFQDFPQLQVQELSSFHPQYNYFDTQGEGSSMQVCEDMPTGIFSSAAGTSYLPGEEPQRSFFDFSSKSHQSSIKQNACGGRLQEDHFFDFSAIPEEQTPQTPSLG